MMKLKRRDLVLGGLAMTAAVNVSAAGKTAWNFKFADIDGGVLDLASLKGRALMVVNTASFCGFTYQYEGLEKLHKKMAAQGLTVVGVPSNDFNQESADNKTIKQFCEANFGVDFPMTGIAHVRGDDADPFFKWVKAEKNWEPSWNFGKVVIGRNGLIIGCFGSSDEPTSFRISSAINSALSAKV